MIKEIKTIEEFSGVSSPLIPRIFSAFKYKTGSDNAWKQVTETGVITSCDACGDENLRLLLWRCSDACNREELY